MFQVSVFLPLMTDMISIVVILFTVYSLGMMELAMLRPSFFVMMDAPKCITLVQLYITLVNVWIMKVSLVILFLILLSHLRLLHYFFTHQENNNTIRR